MTGLIESLLPKIRATAFVLSLAIACHGCAGPRRGVLKGEDFLQKSLFYQRIATPVAHISESTTDGSGERLIAVFGQRSVSLVDLKTGSLKSTVQFDITSISPAYVDMHRDDGRKILCRGGGFGNVGLLDDRGRVIWKRPGPRDTRCASGDLDRDGELEFYVSSWDGLSRVDSKGQIVWERQIPTQSWYVEIFYPDDGSDPRLVVLSSRAVVHLYNRDGLLDKSVQLPQYVVELRLVQWPIDPHGLHFVGLIRREYSRDSLVVMDLDGQIKFEYVLPRLGPSLGLETTLVRFFENRPPYLAVLRGYRGTSAGLSRLSIFSLDGQLVYQEILGRSRGLLAARLRPHDGAREFLLVGDTDPNRVVMYRLKSSKAPVATP